MDKKELSSKKYHIAENLFCVFLGIYLLYILFSTTTFYFIYPPMTTYVILGLLSVTAGLKALLYFAESLRKFHRFPWEVLLAMVPAIAYCLSFLSGRYTFLLAMAVVTVGCVGTGYRKLLTLYTVVAATFLLGTTLCSMCGGITNFVFIKDGLMRSSWGVYYPTDYAAFLIYIALAAWIAAKKIDHYVFILIGIIIIAISFFIMHSNTSTICGILFILILIYNMVIESAGNKSPLVKVLRTIVDVFTVASFFLFSCLVFGAVFIYRRHIPFSYRLNEFMSSRISLASTAIDRYGISLFGKAFTMIGYGGSTFNNANYDFIDSSYVLMLIRCGLVTFSIIALLWTVTTYRAIRIRDRRLALSMALIAFHSVSEHHFIDIFYNILLVMPFAVYALSFEAVTSETPENNNQAHRNQSGSKIPDIISGLIICCLTAAFFIIAFPDILSRARTVCYIWAIKEDPLKKFLLLVVVIILSALVVSILRCAYRIISDIFRLKLPSLACVIILPLCILICFRAYVICEHVIDDSMDDYKEVLTEAEPAVKIIRKNDKAKLYVDRIPEIFNRRFGGVSNSIFSGDELARYDDINVITPAGYESYCFLSRGYLYCQISSKFAIYSSDEETISRLSAAGYHLTGYFAKKKKVDLEKMAELNNLTLSEDGTLALSGKDQALTSGPYLNLRAGKYTTTFKLAIDPDEAMLTKDSSNSAQNKKENSTKNDGTDPTVCTLRISSYSGENIIQEIPVTLSQFNKNGRYNAEITYEIPESIGVEYLVLPEGNQDITVRAIHYQQTPDYDTHRLYDSKYRVIREEYYDHDGNRCMLTPNYSSLNYHYDKDGNVADIYYNDDKDQLTLTSMGYARIHRDYNIKRQIIREDYYGTNEELLTQNGGYASMEFAYDSSDNQYEVSYYDIDHKPVLANGAYATIKRYFDENHHIVKEEYYDEENNICICPEGYSCTQYEYDEKGNRTWVYYKDAEGNPVTTREGCAAIHMIYDEDGRITRREYYDEDGKPVTLRAGYFALEYEYDSNGNQTLFSYYDVDGNPATVWKSHSKEECTYNDKNQLTELNYYDGEGHPISCALGYAIERREYDDISNIAVQKFYDLKGKPVLRSDGYAEVHKSYDESRHIIREEYYGTDGKPILLPAGYSCVICSYDKYGNLTEQTYLDLDGKRVLENTT